MGVWFFAGLLTGADGQTYAFARFNQDGSLDTIFHPTIRGGFQLNGNDIAVGTGWNYFVTGGFSEISGFARPSVARLLADSTRARAFLFVGAGAVTNEDAGSIQVQVRRLGDSSGPLSVSLASTDGTAVAGSDYAPIDVKLNFRPRETLKTVVVPLIADHTGEPDRNFSLSLSRAAARRVSWPLDQLAVGAR